MSTQQSIINKQVIDEKLTPSVVLQLTSYFAPHFIQDLPKNGRGLLLIFPSSYALLRSILHLEGSGSDFTQQDAPYVKYKDINKLYDMCHLVFETISKAKDDINKGIIIIGTRIQLSLLIPGAQVSVETYTCTTIDLSKNIN